MAKEDEESSGKVNPKKLIIEKAINQWSQHHGIRGGVTWNDVPQYVKKAIGVWNEGRPPPQRSAKQTPPSGIFTLPGYPSSPYTSSTSSLSSSSSHGSSHRPIVSPLLPIETESETPEDIGVYSEESPKLSFKSSAHSSEENESDFEEEESFQSPESAEEISNLKVKSSRDEDMCQECGDDIKIRVVVDPCGHQFCFECLHEFCEIADEPDDCPKCFEKMDTIAIDGEDKVYDIEEFKVLNLEDLSIYEPVILSPFSVQD